MFLLFIVAVYCVVVFTYSAKFFPKIYYQEYEALKGKLKEESSHLNELNQIPKQISNLKCFFWSISMIILIRYLVHLLYDLINVFYKSNILPLIYLFTVSFYATEIALVLLISKSITETLKAEKKYL